MNSKIITLITDDLNEILDIKNTWNLEKYIKRFNTELNYSEKLKKLLYQESNYCLDIFNNFIKDIIIKYINEKINFEELKSCLEWNFECKNTKKRDVY